jgi:hypothetical protein
VQALQHPRLLPSMSDGQPGRHRVAERAGGRLKRRPIEAVVIGVQDPEHWKRKLDARRAGT